MSHMSNTSHLTYNDIMWQHPACLNPTDPITHMDLGQRHIKYFPEIQSDTLESLDLSGNQITSVTAEHLKGLPKLQTLNLSGNKLTEIPDLQREGLKVSLEGNRFPCSRGTYEKYESMCEHIEADNELHCQDKIGDRVPFADETGLSEFAKAELIAKTHYDRAAQMEGKLRQQVKPCQIIHILLKKPLRRATFLLVLFLLIATAYGKPMPYCKYTSTPKAMCYCVNCPDYKTCLQLCHDNLEGKPEVIKLQEGHFPKIHKNSTSSTSLERLTLSNCQIREMAPDFFEPYPNLLRFAVFDNNLEDSAAPLHLNLTNNQALTRVELFSNSLTKLPRIRSESLEYLDVRFNSISSLQPEDLRALKKLKTLDLGDNHLTTIGPFEVEHLQQVHLLNNDFPCTSVTYCDFHKNRDYIVADYGVYCKYNNTALTRFADEDGLLPDFHCPAPKKNVTKNQFLIENETTKIHDSVRSRSEFRLYPSPICVISVPLLIGHFNLSWISH